MIVRSRQVNTVLMGRLTRRVSDLLGAVMFVLMFGAIVLQVVSRYVFNYPLGWSDEIATVGFVWVSFWAASCSVTLRDHATFDLIYHRVGPRRKRAFSITALSLLLALLIMSFPDTVAYFEFLSFQMTGVLEINFQVIFATYFVFVIVMIVRGVRELYFLFSPKWLDHV